MKRDLDLCRNLLLELEALPPGGRIEFGGEDQLRAAHWQLLMEGGSSTANSHA